MKYLIFLGHPAHYHLFKNLNADLLKKGHQTKVIIRSKDILEDLCSGSGMEYQNVLPTYRKNNIISFGLSFLKKYEEISIVIRSFRPGLLLGSEPTLAHLGKIFNIPSFIFSEDDASIIPQFVKITYPFVDYIISPASCNAGKWEYKKIGYNGFQKFSYLHPSVFTPDRKYLGTDGNSAYFILRLAALSAYHDKNKTGINKSVAKHLIGILAPYGKIYITSERTLDPEFEKFRLHADPELIHHYMAFAKLYIGDSQSMAVEAALLGTPGIRFNDFAGKIGVLNELENKYSLTHGLHTRETEKLYLLTESLLSDPCLEKKYHERRLKLLNEKINVPAFFLWFFENFPESASVMRKDPDYQYNFK